MLKPEVVEDSVPLAPPAPLPLLTRHGDLKQVKLYGLSYVWATREKEEHHAELKALWKSALADPQFVNTLENLITFHSTQPSPGSFLNAKPGDGWRGALRAYLGDRAPEWL